MEYSCTSMASPSRLARISVGLCFCWVLAVPVGCIDRPARVRPPSINPSAAAAQAMSEYDADGDGELSGDELKKCPGILASMGRYDTSGDGQVSAAELSERLTQWKVEGVGLISLICRVQIDGELLSGAEIRLVPESFLGEAFKPCSGTTSGQGRASIITANADLPPQQQNLRAALVGLYKVRITHPNMDIPAKYNTKTELGADISRQEALEGISFNLTSG